MEQKEHIDIKELNKTQLVLVTLLITFVVSIATGIITVSIMQKMPPSVPTTINRVIEKTIERVTMAPAQVVNQTNTTAKPESTFGDGDALVSIYSSDTVLPIPTTIPNTDPTKPTTPPVLPKALGQGVIVSDVGLVLVESDILDGKDTAKVMLADNLFDAQILKKFGNGFSILKIIKKADTIPVPTVTTNDKPKDKIQ